MTTYINIEKPQTRDQDVEVYKVFLEKEKGLCSNSHWNYCTKDSDGMLVSDPSNEYVWRPGVAPELVEVTVDGVRAVSGYFAYSWWKRADEYVKRWGGRLTWKKCVIPAGTKFYFSTCGRAVVAEQIIVL